MNPASWLQDKRGNWSFTRIAPLGCLVAALAVWLVGTHWKELQGYCQEYSKELLNFAKWAFGAGKIGEEAGSMLGKKEEDVK